MQRSSYVLSKNDSKQIDEKLFLLIEQTEDEIFLNYELPMLNEKYKLKVINFGTNDKPMRVNVDLYHYSISHSKYKSIFYACKAVFDFEFWKEIGRIVVCRKDILKRIKFSVWFYIEAQEQFYNLKRILKLNHGTRAVFYCYWNFVHCLAITSNRWKYPNVKVVSRIHGYDLFHYRMECKWQPFKQAMDRRIDKMVFAADYSMEYYLKFYNIKKQKKHILSYLGTSNEYSLRQFHQDNTLLIVSCSATIPLKRIDLIIKALSMIEKFSIEWVHFGGGSQYDKLKILASEYLKKDNIKWEMRGYTDNREILNYYSSHSVDCFITTTSTEGGMPVSIMEAMSFGIPIIGTDVTSLPQMIRENGILVPANPSPEDIADAIIDMANMPEADIMTMRYRSRRLWEDHYVAKENAKRFIEKVIDQL